jgi:hypothetical protein
MRKLPQCDFVNNDYGESHIKAFIEGLVGRGDIHVHDDVYTDERMFSFPNGKTIKIPIRKFELAENISGVIYEAYSKQIGTVDGCISQLKSFANCEVYRNEPHEE